MSRSSEPDVPEPSVEVGGRLYQAVSPLDPTVSLDHDGSREVLSAHGRQVRLSWLSGRIMRRLLEGVDDATIREELAHELGITAEACADLTRSRLSSGCLLLDPERWREPPPSMLASVTLIQPDRVSGLARVVAPLCKPKSMSWLTAGMLVVLWSTWPTALVPELAPQSLLARVVAVPPAAFLVWIGAEIILRIVHELGHAAALVAQGKRPGGIGMGFYHYLPVFHCGLDECWQLPPKRRQWVNLGGPYFDLLTLGIGVASLRFTTIPAELVPVVGLFVVRSVFGLVFNLLPILRNDGYWIVSDMLRTTDLERLYRETLRWLLGRVWNSRPPELRWLPSHLRVGPAFAGLVTSALLSRLVFLVFGAYGLVFAYAYAEILPASLSAAVLTVETAWASGAYLDAMGATVDVLIKLLLAFGSALFVGNSIRTLARFLRRRGAPGPNQQSSVGAADVPGTLT